MEVVEAPEFTRRAAGLLDDLELWEVQDFLAAHPAAGDLIPRGHGLRKLRWRVRRKARGTRGGLRLVYYWRRDAVLYFVTVYEKSRQEDLSPSQLKVLSEHVRRSLP